MDKNTPAGDTAGADNMTSPANKPGTTLNFRIL
jgi:hypothetical protein